MKKYQELELKVKEIQKEIDRLKTEEKENYLPYRFNVDYALRYLKCRIPGYLCNAFDWSKTPQGHRYWRDRYDGIVKLGDKDIIQIQKWIIIFLQKGQK